MALKLSKPAELEHGDRFGDLTVLGPAKSRTGRRLQYRVGCGCGFQKDSYTYTQLTRANGVTKCSRCRKTDAPDSG